MRCIFGAVILLISATTALSAQLNSRTYNLEIFLEDAMKNYPAWLRENSLDPSPAKPAEILLFQDSVGLMSNMTMKIKDEQMSDYANAINPREVEVEVDMERQFIYLQLSNKGPIKYNGKYTVNGTVYDWTNSTNYNGEGTWTYTIPEGVSENVTYRFHVESDEYANVTQGLKYYTIDHVGREQDRLLNFTGFLNETDLFDDYGLRSISSTFMQAYEAIRVTQLDMEHPMVSQLQRYLAELFEKTPFPDITADK